MPEPVAHENGMLMFGRSGLNIQRIYGIDPKQFLKIHKKLVGMGLETPLEEAKTYITFELYCNELLKMGFDLSILISEFMKAQKNTREDVTHVLSLAKLSYHYIKFGHDVKLIKTRGKGKNPDLGINGLKCDLKVRQDQIQPDMRNYFHLLEKHKEEYHKIYSSKIRSRYEDLVAALENRGEHGFEQADCLIFDLSSHFHSWNYHRINTYVENHATNEVSTKPLAPISGVCIIFSPDSANDLNVTGFYPKAYWTYVIWNQETREFINL